MLKRVISKANLILKNAPQRLTVESAETVEKICVSIENLNNFINIEMDRIAEDVRLSHGDKSSARREVLEKAGRKLEVLKDRSNYSTLAQELDVGISEDDNQDDEPLLKFMREREIRDRLFGMTEAQILSHFGESLFDGKNQLLLEAILNAPPGFEMLSEPNLRRLRKIRLKRVPKKGGTGPKHGRSVNASIIEFFNFAKKELDRLRKAELPGSSTDK
jgi:hypothetical protein